VIGILGRQSCPIDVLKDKNGIPVAVVEMIGGDILVLTDIEMAYIVTITRIVCIRTGTVPPIAHITIGIITRTIASPLAHSTITRTRAILIAHVTEVISFVIFAAHTLPAISAIQGRIDCAVAILATCAGVIFTKVIDITIVTNTVAILFYTQVKTTIPIRLSVAGGLAIVEAFTTIAIVNQCRITVTTSGIRVPVAAIPTTGIFLATLPVTRIVATVPSGRILVAAPGLIIYRYFLQKIALLDILHISNSIASI
jgi:hypothetical protein